MDLDFGHGSIPRIASQKYKAVDRCLGPDTLLDAPLDRVEIALLKVTDSSRDLPAIGERSLLDRFPVELREVSRFRGAGLAGELERLLP